MRIVSLAAFAVLAFAAGFYSDDAMALGLGAAAALAAVASLPSLRLPTFLRLMAELFTVETIIFGLADLINALGYWPDAYKEYALPRYLPVATAVFVIALTLISYIAFVRRMMRIADPFFEATTPIVIRPVFMRPKIVRQSAYGRICVVFLILVNQFQVAIGVRLNYFQMAFGNAIQVPDEPHRVEFWHQLLVVFTPLALISITVLMIEFYVASNFVLQWRRWMTASYTTRWLVNSMHYKLALAGETADNPDQRISQDVGAFINGSGTGSNSGNVGIYNYSITLISSATNLVAFSIILWGLSSGMTVPFLGTEVPGFLFWVATLYAVFATGVTQLIGRKLSRLFFKQQAVEANFRFDLARIREYSEQIALLKGEDREIAHAGHVFEDVFHTIRAIIWVRTWLIAFNQFYSQISGIMPFVVVAPFYYAKKVSFGLFSQAADAFSTVNTQMNFFVDRYIGLADFSSTVNRLTSFDEAFARTLAANSQLPRVVTKPSTGEALEIPELELSLPDGRKLARVGNLILVPQESTLVVGPSGAGKSTLFRAISGLWPFGSGEIHQPAYAKLMLLPQRPYIPIGPLRDAIAYPSAGTAFSDDALREALEKVGLRALVDRLDQADNWQMRLSGGEQQRLAVARALLARPDWLFLDEATASLDEASEAALYRAIIETLPNATLISIGHRSTLAAFHKRRLALQPHEDGPATIADLNLSAEKPEA
jgi:putative ATP-binding cassette transporter